MSLASKSHKAHKNPLVDYEINKFSSFISVMMNFSLILIEFLTIIIAYFPKCIFSSRKKKRNLVNTHTHVKCASKLIDIMNIRRGYSK